MIERPFPVATLPATPQPRGVLLAIFAFPMLVHGFRSAIDAEPDMHVVATVGEPDELPAAVSAARPDVAILECHGGGAARPTIEAIDAVRGARPATRILALECGLSAEQFTATLRAGADGFLTRDADPGDVLAAIRAVGRGETYVSPAIVTRMVNAYVRRDGDHSLDDPWDTLTDQEREILRLAAVGHTNREIAEALRVSQQAVHSRRASIMEKLGLHDRVALLKYAVRRGVIDLTAR